MEPTFHSFSRLPPEIRAQIWALTVEPRTVPIQCCFGEQRATEADPSGQKFGAAVLYAVSLVKQPAVVHVCRESRAQKLYERLILTPGSDVSYAWVNFDVDTIDIGEHEHHRRFKNCGHKIRRLKFRADCWDIICSPFRATELNIFSNLLDCLVVTKGDILHWVESCAFHSFSSQSENLDIIDEKTGHILSVKELHHWWQEELVYHLGEVDVLSPEQEDAVATALMDG